MESSTIRLLGGFFLLLTTYYTRAESWSYDDVASWGTEYPNCDGKRQSPIDLHRHGTLRQSAVFRYVNYEHAAESTLVKNNGHSLELTFNFKDDSMVPRVVTSAVNNGSSSQPVVYSLSNIHFHWGANNSVGSEHTFRGKRYPLEMHMVHIANISDNKDDPGILVVGYTFELCNHVNQQMYKLYSSMGSIVNVNDTANIDNFIPGGLRYRRWWKSCAAFGYQGSLTTPPCTEGVSWFVYEHQLCVTTAMMDAFRKLKNEEGEPLVNNFRPVQNLNGRKVSYYRNQPCY